MDFKKRILLPSYLKPKEDPSMNKYKKTLFYSLHKVSLKIVILLKSK